MSDRGRTPAGTGVAHDVQELVGAPARTVHEWAPTTPATSADATGGRRPAGVDPG